MNRRYCHKPDSNQKAIVSALRDSGALVLDLSAVGSGCPDLLCLLPSGALALVEVKNPDGRGRRFTPAQTSFYAEGWPVVIVCSAAEAVALAQTGAVTSHPGAETITEKVLRRTFLIAEG